MCVQCENGGDQGYIVPIFALLAILAQIGTLDDGGPAGIGILSQSLHLYF